MPVHDWTQVDAGLFHAFHQRWISALSDALNTGCLPPDYFALAEQNIHGPIPDVLTLQLSEAADKSGNGTAGVAVKTPPPQTRLIRRNEVDLYAAKANRITVRHRHGDVVAIIEIVSPGNKASRNEMHSFVEKTADLIRQKVHLLVVDLFPPGPRDPQGIHKAIRDEFVEEDCELPPDKLLVLASYDAGPPRIAYVELIGVGDALPAMPLFLQREYHILTPLEETYQTSWHVFPAPLKKLLESPLPKQQP